MRACKIIACLVYSGDIMRKSIDKCGNIRLQSVEFCSNRCLIFDEILAGRQMTDACGLKGKECN